MKYGLKGLLAGGLMTLSSLAFSGPIPETRLVKLEDVPVMNPDHFIGKDFLTNEYSSRIAIVVWKYDIDWDGFPDYWYNYEILSNDEKKLIGYGINHKNPDGSFREMELIEIDYSEENKPQ